MLVRPVDLVQVDVVRSEVPQAGVDALPKPPAARIAEEPVAIHPQAALGCDGYVFPSRPGPQSITEESFSDPEAVALCGVEERDPELERAADRGLRVVRVEPAPVPAERPRPEGDR